MRKSQVKKLNKREKKKSKITHTNSETSAANIKTISEIEKNIVLNDTNSINKSQQYNELKKTGNATGNVERKTGNSERKTNEQSFISVKFHAYIAPEFEIDINEHENSFGIASDYNWKKITPLKIQ